jgi:hypothetical protein
MYVLVYTCTIQKFSLHQIQIQHQNYSRYQSIRPPLTLGQGGGGLLLVVGVGEGEVCSGFSEEVSACTFLQNPLGMSSCFHQG